MKAETLARIFAVVLLLTAFAIPFVGQRLALGDVRPYVLKARMAEDGGWTPETIRARVGEPLHLRMMSEDVVHSFAVGQSGEAPIDIIPGEVVETTLVFDRPGKYTFYCTRWCGANHWRMRGTIEVTGAAAPVEPAELPLFLQLDIDVDAPHLAQAVPAGVPSAERGRALAGLLPEYAVDRSIYRTHSPEQLWQRLRAESSLAAYTGEDLWDAVAFVWQSQTSPERLELGRQLYQDNCAACHDLEGSGDGVMVRDLPEMSHENMGRELVRPPDFSDPRVLLGASPALLEGKIIRGGMGTGMPSYGPILTDTEIEAVVEYVYRFVLPSREPNP